MRLLHFHCVEISDASADRRSAVSLSPVFLQILSLYAKLYANYHLRYQHNTTMQAGISLRSYPRSDSKLLRPNPDTTNCSTELGC